MLFVMRYVTTFRDLLTSLIEILEGPCGTFYLPSLCLHLPKLVNTMSLCLLPYKWIINQVSNRSMYEYLSDTIKLVQWANNLNQPIILFHCRSNILSVFDRALSRMIPHDHSRRCFGCFMAHASKKTTLAFSIKDSFLSFHLSFSSLINMSIRLVDSQQEPITGSLQLPHILVTAFTQTDLFLVWVYLKFRSPREPRWPIANTNTD